MLNYQRVQETLGATPKISDPKNPWAADVPRMRLKSRPSSSAFIFNSCVEFKK